MSRKSRRRRAVEAAKARHPSSGGGADARVNEDLLFPPSDATPGSRGREACSKARFDMTAIMRKPVIDPFARKETC